MAGFSLQNEHSFLEALTLLHFPCETVRARVCVFVFVWVLFVCVCDSNDASWFLDVLESRDSVEYRPPRIGFRHWDRQSVHRWPGAGDIPLCAFEANLSPRW